MKKSKEEKKILKNEKKKLKQIKKDNKKENKDSNKKGLFKVIAIVVLILILCGLWARFISTRGLNIKEYAIISNNLNEDYDGLKIVQFSDLHFGTTINKKELINIVNNINNQNPDIIVFTGDLVDKDVKLSKKKLNILISELSKLNPKVLTYSVKGNHDYLNKNNYYDTVVSELGWHNLDNSYEYYYSNSTTPLVFIGFDDLTQGKPDYQNGFSYLNETDEDLYTIVLTHEPDSVDEFKNYNFDIALAGHSHLGQVRFPGIGALYTPVGSKKYYDEHYKINESELYISGGIGTSTLKLRFFDRPSINLFRFYTK